MPVGWPVFDPSATLRHGDRVAEDAVDHQNRRRPGVLGLADLVEKVQVPRETRAISKIRLPPGRAEQAVLKPLVVPLANPSGAVRSAEAVANWPATAPKVSPPRRLASAACSPGVLAP